MGNAESQPVRNTDKRTARRDHAHLFKGAITSYRQENGGAPPDTGAGREHLLHDPGDALRVAVRRRPFFKHEQQQGALLHRAREVQSSLFRLPLFVCACVPSGPASGVCLCATNIVYMIDR